MQEYSSGSELLQALEQNDFAKECVAPPKGIKKSSFFEAINTIKTTGGGSVLLKDSTVITDAGTVNPGQWSSAINGLNVGNITVTDSYIKSMNGGWAETVYVETGSNVSISHSKIYANNGCNTVYAGDNIAVTIFGTGQIINSEIHASSTPLCVNNHALQGSGKIANSLIDAPEGDGLALWNGKLFNNYNASFDGITNR